MPELSDGSQTTVRQAGGAGHAQTVVPTIEQHGYDVGPGCPEDDLRRRLDEARARLRLDPPKVVAPLRWSI